MARHVARKRFGQHFLIDRGVIAFIVEAIVPRNEAAADVLVEIGPGLGALTDPLLARFGRLHAVEIDRDIVAHLRQKHSGRSLILHEGDALSFDFGALAAEVGSPLRLVGNLPYNVSTPLLFHLARFAEQISDLHFMLQKEVVDRLAAVPGTAAYGRLTVMLQHRFIIDRLLDVPPEAFAPPPKVDSAVLRLIPRGPEKVLALKDPEFFSALVAAAFAQRRKMLRNNLKGLLGEADFQALGISPTARAEELSVADYVRAANSRLAQIYSAPH